MVNLIGEHAMNRVVSHIGEVKHAVEAKAEEVEGKAKANLEAARASTEHRKIVGPSHLTSTSVSHGETDSFVNLDAPNAMAIELGHAPSGYFDPKKYGKVTKAPHGLYILTRASGGLGDLEFVPAMGRGK